jgi:hypothetical protein
MLGTLSEDTCLSHGSNGSWPVYTSISFSMRLHVRSALETTASGRENRLRLLSSFVQALCLICSDGLGYGVCNLVSLPASLERHEVLLAQLPVCHLTACYPTWSQVLKIRSNLNVTTCTVRCVLFASGHVRAIECVGQSYRAASAATAEAPARRRVKHFMLYRGRLMAWWATLYIQSVRWTLECTSRLWFENKRYMGSFLAAAPRKNRLFFDRTTYWVHSPSCSCCCRLESTDPTLASSTTTRMGCQQTITELGFQC